jgi:uncharacterized protein (TIGR00297 family)
MNHLAAGTGILPAGSMQKLWLFAALSGIFALVGRVVRGVTSAGAITGALVCFVLLWAGGVSAFAALLAVFLLTWLATRFGYRRKEHLGIAESRRGRNALQVLANLGSATACALLYARFPNPWVFAAMAAALAEPAADTISSEIGQVFGGTPRLITTSQRVSPGTNGAVTGIGTAAGAIAAMVVAFVFLGFGEIGRASFFVVALSGVAGMIGDSLLGATVEGRARLGNNAVNFISTIIAATIAFLLAP